jgi:hypothetical protein
MYPVGTNVTFDGCVQTLNEIAANYYHPRLRGPCSSMYPALALTCPSAGDLRRCYAIYSAACNLDPVPLNPSGIFYLDAWIETSFLQRGCTIRLRGPGGDNGTLIDVEPGKTVDKLTATVTCGGEPKPDVVVSIDPNVVANSGGHQHHDLARETQHNGRVATIRAVTDAGGDAIFSFTAPAPAGDHR